MSAQFCFGEEKPDGSINWVPMQHIINFSFSSPSNFSPFFPINEDIESLAADLEVNRVTSVEITLKADLQQEKVEKKRYEQYPDARRLLESVFPDPNI